MKIAIIGTGKLGLSLALNIENGGHDVVCVDNNSSHIQLLKTKQLKTSEPFVDDMLKSSNIRFTTQLSDAFDCDVFFCIVPTPSTNEFKYDHKCIDSVIDELINLGQQKSSKHFIINSTIFPGYTEEICKKLNPLNYTVSYNPEFIAQGTIIKDQQTASQVLIGTFDNNAAEVIKDIYTSFMSVVPIFNIMSPTEAEITKLSINCFLTTKISFANMIGDISTEYGCNPDVILNAIGTDERIGNKYLKYGFGFGGPCFPRDNRALISCANDVGINATISKATDEMNDLHFEYQLKKIIDTHDINEPIIFNFLTYKKDSILLEESQYLRLALELKKRGFIVINNDIRSEVLNQLKNII